MIETVKKFRFAIIFVILVAIVGIFVFVNAGNTPNYVLDVVDAKDTEQDGDDNTEIKIQKRILKDNNNQPYYDQKNLTYQVDVTNMSELKAQEIALIVDSSYSIDINDEESLIKAKAQELARTLGTECNKSTALKTTIKLYNAGRNIRNVVCSTANGNTIANDINGLVLGAGNNIADTISVAKDEFTAGDVDKYIIIFTDSTDNVKELIQQAATNDIKVITILVDNIVSNSYIDMNTNKPLVGKLQMIYNSTFTEQQKTVFEEFNAQKIANIVNSSLLNVQLTDVFESELIQFFDFDDTTVYINGTKVNKQNDAWTITGNELTRNDSGYLWKIDNIRRGETKTVKFRLNLREDQFIDAQSRFYNISVSDNITATYKMQTYESEQDINDTFTLGKEFMPVIQICDPYSVTLRAVSEENYNLPVEGVEFSVIAKDLDGNIVYNKTLTTNSRGEVIVENLITSGIVHFEVKPNINQNGYDKTDDIEFDLTNDNGNNLDISGIDWEDKKEINNTKRNITLKIPINTRKFNIEINLEQLNNSNVTIGNTEFRLIQPKLNNKYEMQAKFGKTDANGKLIFAPTVMTKGGTYDYMLSQMDVQTGFVSLGNVTIRVEFDDNGNVLSVKSLHNDNVTAELRNPSHILVKAQNASEMDETFGLEIHLEDQDDRKIKIDGAKYDIELYKGPATAQPITFSNYITDDKGKILLDLPINTQFATLKIKQKEAKTGYDLDTETKVITIKRENGVVQSVQASYNEGSNTPVDAMAYPVENKVLVNLTNKMKAERNIVEVHLTDSDEKDIYVPNVDLQLINTTTKKVYTATTDIDGMARFQIDDQDQGSYVYTLKVVKNLPAIYNVIPDVNLSLRFDQNRHLEDVSDLWDDTSTQENPLYSLGYEDGDKVKVVDNVGFADYQTVLNLGAIVNDANTYWFEIQLTEENNSRVKIEGATYDIQITSGGVTRNLTGRKTDSAGKIRTRLLLGEEISVEVTQTNSDIKHKADGATKEILLRYINNTLEFVDTAITNTIISGNTVIYSHINALKGGNDVYLDLTINKEDAQSGGFVGGLPVRIYQESQGDNFVSVEKGGYDQNNVKYGSFIETSGESNSPIPFDQNGLLNVKTKTNSQGTIVLKDLRINNVPIPGEAQFVINVVEVDEVTGLDKEATLVKLKFTYRYNENKQIVELTNVESTVGNRLVKKDSKVLNGYASARGYESNVIITLFANYDDVGNLALDLNKLDINGNKIEDGAIYTARVIRPDGSSNLIPEIEVIDGEIELKGLMVTVGSHIELTEKEAPHGYAKNEATEILEVSNINKDGQITLRVLSNNYKIPRVNIKFENCEQTTAGMKTLYSVDLIDYELDTFKMKIVAIDSTTEKPVPGYSFEVTSDKGAKRKSDVTNQEGEVETLVGGNYKNETVTYNVSTNKAAQYYKDITAFTLKVPFDEDEYVDTTNNNIFDIQSDRLYGELADGKRWKIKQVNESNGSDIILEVYVEPDDPLEIEIQTYDGVSGSRITTEEFKYAVPESVNLSGEGELNASNNTTIKVGYVERNASKTYTIKTEVPDNYIGVPDQQLTINYDTNGNITANPAPEMPNASTFQILSRANKKIVLKNTVQPKQGIQIVNKDYFTGNNISGAEFEITTPDNEKIKTEIGLEGIVGLLGSKHGDAGAELEYGIHQTKPADGYATIPDFRIRVTYNNNRQISKVETINKDSDTWVNVSAILPSNSGHVGFNGNAKGIIKLEINSYYDFRVNIENVDRLNNNIKIAGTQYELTSTISDPKKGEATTNTDGIGIAHLDELKTDTTVVYTIKEKAPADDYQALEAGQIDVEVSFDSDGFVIPSSVRILQDHGDDYATVLGIDPPVEDTDKFTINLTVTSNPKFRINITNKDKWDNTKLLAGTKYKVTSDVGNSIAKDEEKETDGNGNIIIRVDGNTGGREVTYTIHEERPSLQYQSIEQDIEIKVIFEADGTIRDCILTKGKNTSISKVTNIVTTFDNFTINVDIESIQLLDFVINSKVWLEYKELTDADYPLVADDGTVYQAGDLYDKLTFVQNGQICEIKEVTSGSSGSTTTTQYFIRKTGNISTGFTYKISATEISSNTNLEVDKTGATDGNGQTIIGMDKALSNKTIRYTISEIKKPIGFKWLDFNILVEVSFDNDGKMIDKSWKIVADSEGNSANSFAKIVNVVIDDHEIYLDIISEYVDEFGISLSATDIYTQAPINKVQANAYLTTGENHVSDGTYDFGVINKEANKGDLSGLTPSQIEDREELAEKYRFLYTGADRDFDGQVDQADGLDYLSMGKYAGGAGNRVLRVALQNVPEPYQYYNNNTGSSQDFAILISVNFDDEGHITSASLITGKDAHTGWKADGHYVSVSVEGNSVISISLRFYPMLYTKLEATDMYTGDVLDSRIKMSTSRYREHFESNDDRIQLGYIGDSDMYIDPGNASTIHVSGAKYEIIGSHEYQRTAKAEASDGYDSRIFYLYEEAEPNASNQYYQRYRPRDYEDYNQSLIGIIQVFYNVDGTIKDAKVLSEHSSNNITKGFIELHWEDGYKLQIKVKYVPTTKMAATIVDKVSGTPLGNIELYPFNNGKIRYRYMRHDEGYETTSGNGQAGWTYWGANEAGTQNTYIIDTEFNSEEYNGYFLPGEIKIDVAYDDTGRIASAKVLSQNTFGDAANAETTWEDTTVNITIMLDRRFNLKIHKKDMYNSNENLKVQFEIKSSKSETVVVDSWQTTTVGRVHAGETVEYILSEVSTIDGYIPLKNIKMYVEFNTDGTVERAYVDPNYTQYFEEYRKAGVATGKNDINKTDLEVIVKNMPTLQINGELTDAFYNSLKLEGGTFTLKNNKGDSQSGGIVTDENGKFTTTIGQIYPNEEVEYTLKQTNIINNYQSNTNLDMVFVVKYNETGNIESYFVKSGEARFNIKPQIFNGKKYLNLDITNEPKYVNIGIVNTDENTEEGINDVTFKVIEKNRTYITQTGIDGEGTVANIVDNVQKANTDRRVVTYTISEITIPDTYRKIQDVVVDVIYNRDGSIYGYNIIENKSNVGVKVYSKGTDIEKLNGLPVHIKLDVKNDNRYDLIIKDKDTEFPDLGIEGTKYDVSINGVSQELPLTNELGETGKYKIDGSGTITIRIAENGVGTGYRADNTNDTTIVLEKGTGVYSLVLNSNSNPTKATVEVDESKGTVTVTFKNETKLELDLLKNDINTGEVLANAVFEITAQEKDARGNNIGVPKVVTQNGVNDITGADGKLHFDLGVTPQNTTIEYTIKETQQPTGYDPIEEIKVTAKFDMYGQLQELTDNSYRTETLVNSENKNGMIVIVGNGLVNPEYVVKVATEDSTTNKRINGAIFDIAVSKSDGTEIKKVENAVTQDITKGQYVVEKGVSILDSLTEAGEIIIDVDQKQPANGYELSAKTSGTVKVNVDYQAGTENLEAIIDITKIEDDGFDVKVDNTNREIIIILKNKSAVTLNIDKYYEVNEVKDSGTENKEIVKVEKPIEGAKFTITSEIQESKQIITTDLNKETKSTDEEGKTITGIGSPYAGKTVIYTLKETPAEGFEAIDDIVILVQYNTSGNIKYTEILSNEDVTEITEDGKGTKELSIKVKNIKKPNNAGYKVALRKHSIENGEYDYLIPGAKYQIIVNEEYGTQKIWEAVTNDDGVIESQVFTGYGRINVRYRELEAPEGYKLDSNEYELEFLRDKSTGYMSIITNNDAYSLDNDESIAYVDPKDELETGRYDLIINKIDAANNKRITSDDAIFNVSIFETQEIIEEQRDENGNIVYDNDGNPLYVTHKNLVEKVLGSIKTDSDGKAKLIATKMPEKDGKYKMKIYEAQAPEGYEAGEEGYFINVTFETDAMGTMKIVQPIENLSKDYIDVLKTDEQLIAINIKNKRKVAGLKDNEFAFDITKVDSETGNAIIDNIAVFKFNDTQYIETDEEYGKLQLPYMDMPKDSDFVNEDGTQKQTVERSYKLLEIRAPEGYIASTEPIDITIKFAKDSKGKVIIQDVKVIGEETIVATQKDNIISFNIENEEGTLVNNAERGKYTLNILKVDGETQEPITGHATFVVTLENGQKVTASTDENGNLQIKDINVPITVNKDLGPYNYTIEETKAASGYELLNGVINLEVTFKALEDPETGKPSGLYAVDTAVLRETTPAASITGHADGEINLKVENVLALRQVTYDANCEDTTLTDLPEPQEKIANQDLILDSTVPKRDEYVFIGWSKDPNATEPEYQPGATFTENENTTLYAVWEEKLYIRSENYKILNATVIPKGVIHQVVYDTDKTFEYNEGDRFIAGILPRIYQLGNAAVDKETKGGTFVDDLKNNLNTNAEIIKVTKKKANGDGVVEDVDVTEKELIGTGMTVEFIKGTQSVKLETVVPGDLTGGNILNSADGRWVDADRNLLSGNLGVKHEEIKNHGEAFEIALDIDMNGRINTSDYTVFKDVFNKDISKLKQKYTWLNR